MACYIKTFNNEVIKVTDEDVKNLAGKQGLVWISSINEAINISTIRRILTEEKYKLELREERKNSERGVLHDGTPVVRKFGRYILEADPECMIDSRYYPEVAMDCVPTVSEWEEKYKQIPIKADRLEAVLEVVDYRKRLCSGGEGFKPLGDIKKLKINNEKN